MKEVESKQDERLERMRSGWVPETEAMAGAKTIDDVLAATRAARFEANLPVEQLVESPWNPRKRFDPDSMRELTDSIREKGVVTPLLARPLGLVDGAPRYEIGAGHRRFRGAKAAGRATVPVVIRAMSDPEFLELLIFENDQRKDVHELEEAQGFQTLLEQPGYDVARIAARIGRSPKYVYDRLKLLQLIPAAQELFLRDLFTAGHAILLARLQPADQQRAIELDEWGEPIGGMFRSERSLFDVDEDDESDGKPKDPYAAVKPSSVRELEAWIQRSVRVEPTHVDAFLFPQSAQDLEAAADDRLGVILITRQHRPSDDVRGAGKEKVFGEQAWHRADGEQGSKTCDRSRMALVACGPGQGDTFRVCIAKEKCAVHWSAWQKARAKRQAEGGRTGGARSAETQQNAEEQRKRAEDAEQAMQVRWKKATPAMLVALGAAVRKAPVSKLVAKLCRGTRWSRPAEEFMAAPRNAEDFVRLQAFEEVAAQSHMTWDWERKRFAEGLKAFGVDAMQILNEAAPAEPKKAALQTSAKPAGAPRGKKKARR